MAANPFIPVQFTPSGGVTSDVDPRFRMNGNYDLTTKNIQFLTQGGSTTPSIEPTLGNIFAAALAAITAQNKIFRIYIDAINSTDTYTLSMSNGNSALITTATWTSSASDVNTTANSAIAAITAAMGLAAQTFTVSAITVTSVTQGYFDFSITTVASWDYSVSLTSVGNSDPTLPIVIQEAIDGSLAGQLQVIGSYDLNGDTFIWSTTQTNLPSFLNIQDVTASPNAPLIRVTLAGHGLATGDHVIINNVQINPTGVHEANGSWIVDVIDPNNFDLLGSAFLNVALPNTGQVTVNPQGIGEIGVAEKNDNDETWTYTTLLRSKQFNFVTKRQPKTYCERNDILASLYWTDNYNVPRVLYYAGAYMNNGALSFVNPLGEYEYGTIGQEIILIRNVTTAKLTNFVQLQSTGNVTAGNHYYAIRLLTENLTATLVSDISQACPVYIPDDTNTYVNAQLISGNPAGTITGKINQFTIIGIIPNLFKYVELIDVIAIGGAYQATIVKRDLLTQQPTQIIQHTGFETDTQTFDISNFLAIQSDIFRALNIDAVSNRLILSNTTTSESLDFSLWTQSWRHNVKRKDIAGIKSVQTGTLQVAEFEVPENVFNNAGYMLNEIYRLAAKFKLKSGGTTETFWIDDIRIDDFLLLGVAFNRGNPFGDNRRNVGGSLPDMNITDAAADFVFVPHIEFTNINLDFLINGTAVRDLVDEIVIERVEMVENFREVIGSGISVMGYVFTINEPPDNVGTPASGLLPLTPGGWVSYLIGDRFSTLKNALRHTFWTYAASIDGFNQSPYDRNGVELNRQDIMEFPWAGGADTGGLNTPAPIVNPTYNDIPAARVRTFSAFYSPDILFNETQYNFIAGDVITCWGAPSVNITTAYGGGGGNYATTANNLREFTGFTNVASVDYLINEGINIARGANVSMQGGTTFFSKAPFIYQLSTDGSPFPTPSVVNQMPMDVIGSPVFHTTTAIQSLTANTDYGVYQSQVFRAKTNKFGSIFTSKYISTSAYITVDGAPSLASVEVFGGDTMTQKMWMKHIRNNAFTTVNQGTGNDWALSGSNQGFGFYAQNRVNSQLPNRTESTNSWKYPQVEAVVWLNNCAATSITYISEPTVNLSYNDSYTLRNGITSDSSFDPNLKRSNRQPARIWWSDLKPENSIVDNYAIFLPLNFKDLQLAFGEITEHKNVNSQLMTLQPGHFELQYFDSTGLLVTNAQEAVLGNAGVMAQRGTALSTYGMDTPYAAIIGRTAGGKDCIAWIDTKHGKVVKFDPSQGTTVISDVQQMRWFFNNYTRLAGLYRTPADGEGIHGIWDHINSEFIWTFRAKKTGVSTWNSLAAYIIGDVVDFTATDFHGLASFYRATEVNIGLDPVNNPDKWEVVPFTEYNYYNVFTIAYNEVKNKFTTFYSFLPKIYLKRGKAFLSPRPVDNEGRIYEHLRGDYCTWYTQGASELTARWRIGGMSINEKVNLDKHFLSLMLQTKLAPKRIEVQTAQYSTFMTDADCEQMYDQFRVPIKNNVVNGSADGDTSYMIDSWASVSLEGDPKIYTNFFDFIMRYRYMPRAFNT